MNTAARIATGLLLTVTLTPLLLRAQDGLTDVATISERLRLFAPATLTADLSMLSAGDREALAGILRAARTVEDLYMYQEWEGNLSLREQLRGDTSAEGRVRLRYFMLNLGPWSVTDRYRAFLPDVPDVKPARGTLYPPDMTRTEWGPWFIKLNDAVQKKATGPLHVIRRDSSGSLVPVPYSVEYAARLAPAGEELRSAAGLVTDSSTKHTLLAIAGAFGDDDYAAAEKAMLGSSGPLNIMIGPTDRSADGLFRYKRGFEAVVGLRNTRETERLAMLENHLPAIEKHLTGKTTIGPGDTRGATIRVDDALYMGGGARVGAVGTAVRLPSDTSHVKGEDTRTTILRNVHEAKFRLIQKPIADAMLNPAQAAAVTFDAFFLHMMMHELTHRLEGSGPDTLPAAGGKPVGAAPAPVALEEARADAAALAGLQFLIDKGTLDKKTELSLYATEFSSLLRALRFGLTDAYATGAAIQLNYYLERQAVLPDSDGRRFRVDIRAMQKASRELFSEIASLLNDPSAPRRDTFTAKYAVVPPGLATLRERLNGVPYDLEPSFPSAP